jgi:hypothetical protein
MLQGDARIFSSSGNNDNTWRLPTERIQNDLQASGKAGRSMFQGQKHQYISTVSFFINTINKK